MNAKKILIFVIVVINFSLYGMSKDYEDLSDEVTLLREKVELLKENLSLKLNKEPDPSHGYSFYKNAIKNEKSLISLYTLWSQLKNDKVTTSSSKKIQIYKYIYKQFDEKEDLFNTIKICLAVSKLADNSKKNFDSKWRNSCSKNFYKISKHTTAFAYKSKLYKSLDSFVRSQSLIEPYEKRTIGSYFISLSFYHLGDTQRAIEHIRNDLVLTKQDRILGFRGQLLLATLLYKNNKKSESYQILERIISESSSDDPFSKKTKFLANLSIARFLASEQKTTESMNLYKYLYENYLESSNELLRKNFLHEYAYILNTLGYSKKAHEVFYKYSHAAENRLSIFELLNLEFLKFKYSKETYDVKKTHLLISQIEKKMLLLKELKDETILDKSKNFNMRFFKVMKSLKSNFHMRDNVYKKFIDIQKTYDDIDSRFENDMKDFHKYYQNNIKNYSSILFASKNTFETELGLIEISLEGVFRQTRIILSKLLGNEIQSRPLHKKIYDSLISRMNSLNDSIYKVVEEEKYRKNELKMKEIFKSFQEQALITERIYLSQVQGTFNNKLNAKKNNSDVKKIFDLSFEIKMKKINVILKTLNDLLLMDELKDKIGNKFFADLAVKTFQIIRDCEELTRLFKKYKEITLNRMTNSQDNLLLAIEREAIKLSELNNLKKQIFDVCLKELKKLKPQAIALLDARMKQHLSVSKSLVSLYKVQGLENLTREKNKNSSHIELEKKYLEILKESNSWDFLR